MYSLSIAMKGQTLRSHDLPSASRALKSWHSEEETGYDVTCRDEGGRPVTKAALREAIRAAGPIPAAAPD